MKFNQLIRRLHLYLALALLPWVFIYGISAIPMTRPYLSDNLYNNDQSLWILRSEQPYNREVPDGLSRSEMQVLGAKILEDLGIEVRSRSGAYSLRKHYLTTYVLDFWAYARITYDIEKQHIKIEDKRFRWNHLLTGLHQRGGFGHGSVLNDFWAIVVDLVAIGFVLWVASGLYMWWHLKQTRRWGLAALLSGLLSFTAFIIAL